MKKMLLSAIIVVVFGVVFITNKTNRNELLKTSIDGLKPGISKSEVIQLMQSDYFICEENSTNILWPCVLWDKNASVKSRLYYSRGKLGHFWESPEIAYLYFDASNRLVGLNYSSSSH